jgi:hypothetical protein
MGNKRLICMPCHTPATQEGACRHEHHGHTCTRDVCDQCPLLNASSCVGEASSRTRIGARYLLPTATPIPKVKLSQVRSSLCTCTHPHRTFMKYWHVPLRLYPLGNLGSNSMHLSAACRANNMPTTWQVESLYALPTLWLNEGCCLTGGTQRVPKRHTKANWTVD